MGFSTDAIHAGQEPDPSTGAITVPIYQTSTYVQDALGKHKGYEYARTANPTRLRSGEEHRGSRERDAGFAFASGMATISSVMMLLKNGDHVICTDNVYGGTYRVFTQIFSNFGWNLLLWILRTWIIRTRP